MSTDTPSSARLARNAEENAGGSELHGRGTSLRELTGDQAQVEEAGAFLVMCANVRRHQLVARSADAECVQNLEPFLLAAIDASLFAQNLVLAFESMPAPRPRLPVDAVRMKATYASNAAMTDWIGVHDEDAARTYEERGAAGRNWSSGLWRKFREPRREHLLAHYRSKEAKFE